MEISTYRPITRQHLRRIDQQQQALLAISRMWREYEGDFKRAVREITETASRAIDIERVSVWLYDHQRRVIRCSDLYEASPDQHTSGGELGAADFPTYFKAMETQEVIAAEDALRDPRTGEFGEPYLKPHGIGAMLDAPIRVGGRLAGVLCHEHIGGLRCFHTFEVNAATYLANMVAAAIEFQRHRESELEAKRSLSLLRAAFEASGAALLAVNQEGSVIEYNRRVLDLWGMPEYMIKDEDPCVMIRSMAAQTIDAKAFLSRMRAVCASASEESQDVVELLDGRVIECTSQPQQLDEHVIGRVWSYRDITQKHRLEQQLREMSVRDPLTGLFNRRHMNEILSAEMARTRRSGKTFCIALLDIDHFKKVNDTFGHDVGDKVLCDVAADLRDRLRATDHAGRWGGEEFMVVLSDTPIEGAVRVIDDLRRHIGRERDSLPHVTVSGGVAEYDEQQPIEKLICVADERLYEAKRTGRDRIIA